MRLSQRRLRLVLVLGAGFLLTAIGVLAYATGGLRGLELETVDARFAVRGTQPAPSDLVVVQVDDVTFSELNKQWPFPRSVHGRVVDRIAADRPRVIAYDVQFSEPSDSEDEDLALAQALADARPPAVLSTTEVDERGQGKFLGAAGVPPEIGARLGNSLFPNDPGGVIRRMSYSVDKLKSFSVVVVETARGHELGPDGFDDDQNAWIDYYGPPGTIRAVSFSRVAQNKLPRGFFRDKVVVVGASAPSLQDLHPTSTSADDEMSGPEIQANALATVRRGLPLQSTPPALDVALIVLLGLAAPIISLRFSGFRVLALSVGVGLAYAVAAQLAFNQGRVLPVLYPMATLAIVSVAVLAAHYLTALIEHARARDLFARFVPEDVVDDVLASADDGLRLGGVLREGTVMFTDLRGFTSFAEALVPSRVMEVLNRYLSEMSDAILDHGGTLIAYMGDGIMAVFGAPLEQEDHADRALAAAREMLDQRLPRFNEWLRAEGLGDGFRMGIGLNSGSIMSGNVGSQRRVEYTAIGDTTNTAARLESMTKGTSHQLFLSEATRSTLKHSPSDLLYIGELEVRGRQATLKLWSLPPPDEAHRPPQ